MDLNQPQRSGPPPMKGSWEDLLARAQAFALDFDDAAIPLFLRVFEGISALPLAARMAGNGRLQNLMQEAGNNLFGYYNIHERYGESLALYERLHAVSNPEARAELERIVLNVHLMLGQEDEALTRFRTLANAPDATPGHWAGWIIQLTLTDRAALALPLVDEFQQAWERGAFNGIQPDQEALDWGYIQMVRAVVMLELGQVEAAVALVNELIETGADTSHLIHGFYSRLVYQKQLDIALKFIDHDRDHPIPSNFWRGVVLRQKKELPRARRVWQEAVKPEHAYAQQEHGISELILAYYYLDSGRNADSSTLEILQELAEKAAAPDVVLQYLMGLGYAIQGNLLLAPTEFEDAVNLIKSTAQDRHLSKYNWFHLVNLLPADELPVYAEYFNTEYYPVNPDSLNDELSE